MPNHGAEPYGHPITSLELIADRNEGRNPHIEMAYVERAPVSGHVRCASAIGVAVRFYGGDIVEYASAVLSTSVSRGERDWYWAYG
jgi:hypothetical protein